MNTLLLSSGGIKGISFLGVWKYIQEKKIEIKTFSGVSIGSLFSLLFILDFTYEEIYNILIKLDFLDLFHFNFTDFLDLYGMIDILPFENFILQKIEDKGFNKTITFEELFQKTGKELHTYAVCVNTEKLERFDKYTTPNCPIWMAVKMSISIPFIFPPVIYNNYKYIDGAFQNGFPIELYDFDKTIPCLVTEEKNENIYNIFEYTYKIINSMKNKKINPNVCLIYNKIGKLDITLTKNTINDLINIGYKSITNWIDDNDLK